MILDTPQVDVASFEQRTGWALKTEGACKGPVCIPLPAGSVVEGKVGADVLSERLGMPLIHDEAAGLWALGPETLTGRTLLSAEAPELALPDIVTGKDVALSSLRGQKVVLVAWAPY